MQNFLKIFLLFGIFSITFFQYTPIASADFMVSSKAQCKAIGGDCQTIGGCEILGGNDIGPCSDDTTLGVNLLSICCIGEPNITKTQCENGQNSRYTTCRPDNGASTCEPDEIIIAECDNTTGFFSNDHKCCQKVSLYNVSTVTGLDPVTPIHLDYEPLEGIPGTEGTPEDFPAYVQALYKFMIWGVAIAALLMLIIGGFWYMTAAGNNAQLTTAKKIIWDAILGIFIAFFAWIILFTINPDLVNVDLSSLGAVKGTKSITTGGGGGNCQPAPSGPCSEAALAAHFESNAFKAGSICMKESGGNPRAGEDPKKATDYCKPERGGDGSVVSFGLFQINLTWHNVGGHNCPDAFDSRYTGTNQGCHVTDPDLYAACKKAALDPEQNAAYAASLSQGGTDWSQWSTNDQCRF